MRHRSARLIGIVVAGLAVVALSNRAKGAAQAPAAPSAPAASEQEIPQITAGRVEQVTVDVVVLDRKGRPVTNLTRKDFTILEEGRPETIVSFDVIDRRPEEQAPPSGPEPRVVTNVGRSREESQPGRTFVILFDDLHLTFVNAGHAKRAVAAFLDKGAVEGDRVTLLATSGAAWWTTRMNGGREDLLAILKRLEGRRVLETATDRITDYEAMQIIYYRDVLVAARVQDRLEKYGTKLLQEPDKEMGNNAREFFQRGVVDPFVENLALQTYVKAKSRMEATLNVIERATRALTEGRDRKALLLVSEGFIDDRTQAGMKRVIEAARRANATVYFIDASGLKALNPMYSAEFGPAADSRDTMAAIADLSRESEGAAALADDTGGFSIRDTNDFETGTVRIGRESQSYYLLGYNPGDIPHDGRFRKIEVKVRGDYTVRARRGYYAPAPEGEAPFAPPKGIDAALQHALDTSTFSDGIPLRMTAYVMDEVGMNRTRVMVVADVDVSKVQFRDVEGQPHATLDTIVVVAHRDSGEALRNDQQVEIRRRAGAMPTSAGPMWYSFVREFTVAPGEHQAKLVVRDAATDRVGTLIYGFTVPPSDQLRVSTPVITDRLTDTGSGPTPALITRRAFPATAQLYCRFDVYGAAKGSDGLPRVRSGYSLRRRTGEILGNVRPTLIEPTSLGAVARMVQIPLRSLTPGDYEMVLTVSDDIGGTSRELVEPFEVTPPTTARR